ncbi:MAG: hypothetical protein R3F35_23880 [Myxococcota bacterium]
MAPVPALAAEGDPIDPPDGRGAAAAPVETVAERAAQIHALIAGDLDVAIDPRVLFDVSLADESAIAVERARLSIVIDAADALASADAARVAETSKTADGSKTGAARSAASRKTPAAKPAGKPAARTDAKAGGLEVVEAELRRELDGLDPAAWQRRLALDRARLAFYVLPAERRQALLDAHAVRQEAAMPRESEEERRAREAEEERLRALEAARLARSEGERLVREEDARLIALGESLDRVQAGFEKSRVELVEHRDVVLGWQRRVREAQAGPVEVADETYDALRVALRQARDALASALDALRSDETAVPALGEDALRDVPSDVPSASVRERRVALAAQIVLAREQEQALREERARMLEEEVSLLNQDRLALLNDLSSDKHDAIVGFTAAGFDQARAEARHLALIVRFRDFAVRHWLASLRDGGARAQTVWGTAAILVPWTIFAAIFLSLRRRTPSLVRSVELRFEQVDRAQRRTLPSLPTRAMRVFARIHRPIEWIAFLAGTLALLPGELLGLLEVQLLASIAVWVLGGRLVVGTIDALAAVSGSRSIYEDVGAAELRLRSLRLVGRTIVVLALILIVSDRLVGEGTIYSWVLSVCWFAAIPVFLVLVRWWRGTVFARIDRVRRKSTLEAWVLANREGWKSFLAAMVGAVHLFATGAVKLVRRWMSGFEVARRIHAYLFQREIERLEEDRKTVRFQALAPEVLEALHPERSAERWLPCPADELVRTLSARVEGGRGGLVAIVGPKGMGKSSLLRALHERHEGSVLVTCRQQTTLEEIRSAVACEPDGAPRLILLDDVQALVRLVIGGMRAFDALGVFARDRCAKTLWVYGVDSSIAPYLERWRDARPLFDEIHRLEPWSEVEIGVLLRDRCRSAEISPIFDDLLERMPIGADELDRYDALKAKQAGYERMLWDHASGNPGIALEVWRSSLARDAAGVVHVRPLQVPDATPLDGLPDTALFVLRAVLQSMPAAVEDVAEATRLSRAEVLDLIRFGQTRGVFAEEQGRFRISWSWLRPVLRILERRGLMVAR